MNFIRKSNHTHTHINEAKDNKKNTHTHSNMYTKI